MFERRKPLLDFNFFYVFGQVWCFYKQVKTKESVFIFISLSQLRATRFC